MVRPSDGGSGPRPLPPQIRRDLAAELRDIAARREQQDAKAARVTPEQARNIGTLHATYPTPESISVPFGILGKLVDDPQVKRVAAANVEKPKLNPGGQASGGWLSRMWETVRDDAMKPLTRYSFAGASAPFEAVQHMSRVAAGAVEATTEGGIGQANEYLREHGSLGDVLGATTVGAGIAEAKERGQLGSMMLGVGDEDIAGNTWFINPKESVVGEAAGPQRPLRRSGRRARLLGGPPGGGHVPRRLVRVLTRAIREPLLPNDGAGLFRMR